MSRDIRPTGWHDPAAEQLRAEQRAEIAERYGTPDSEPGIAPSADDVSYFLVAYEGDEPVACGGLRELDADHAEIKRMFVRPAHRGTGVAASVLAALEAEGVRRGYSRLVLETGTEQPDAVRFYTREGYGRIENFGHYAGHEASLCFEKGLPGTSASSV